MKRSKNINIAHMRSFAQRRVRVKPLALAIAATTLVACSSREEVVAYDDVAQCIAANPDNAAQCESAYDTAREKAINSGPKYRTLADCQAEFGPENCVEQRGPNGQSWIMPAMAGFMLGRAFDGGGYRSAPLFTSSNRNSPAFGRWTSVDGNTYGSRANRRFKADADAFKPKPAVTRTMSRGGFGSTVAAKSSWGGSRRGGWGG